MSHTDMGIVGATIDTFILFENGVRRNRLVLPGLSNAADHMPSKPDPPTALLVEQAGNATWGGDPVLPFWIECGDGFRKDFLLRAGVEQRHARPEFHIIRRAKNIRLRAFRLHP